MYHVSLFVAWSCNPRRVIKSSNGEVCVLLLLFCRPAATPSMIKIASELSLSVSSASVRTFCCDCWLSQHPCW